MWGKKPQSLRKIRDLVIFSVSNFPNPVVPLLLSAQQLTTDGGNNDSCSCCNCRALLKHVTAPQGNYNVLTQPVPRFEFYIIRRSFPPHLPPFSTIAGGLLVAFSVASPPLSLAGFCDRKSKWSVEEQLWQPPSVLRSWLNQDLGASRGLSLQRSK